MKHQEWLPSYLTRKSFAPILVALMSLAACGGNDLPGAASKASGSGAAIAPPQTVTTTPEPAPFKPPVPTPGVGAQFANSPTGIPYPPLSTLYPGHNGPTVDDGMVLPWLSMRAPKRFSATVQTSFDTDHDGKKDRIALRIVQPAEVDEGLKTPVIVRPSVYYADPDYAATEREPFLGEAEYLRMGFTVIYADSLGTNLSDGCWSVMDSTEGEAMAAVVRWLTGDKSAPGFDDKDNPLGASWSTGHVAMEGISYGGTLPSMVAITGVPGLEAIVPVEGISNGYDYFRYNGVISDVIGTISLTDYLSAESSTRTAKACATFQRELSARSDDATLAYNDFWKARNTLAHADRIKAATLVTQGQDDNNVKTKNGVQLYNVLYNLKKPVQLWLHSRNHDDPVWQKEWAKEVLLWYSRYLFGVNNGVETQPAYARETPAGDKPTGGSNTSNNPDSGDNTLIGHCKDGHNPRDCIPTGELIVKEQAWPATQAVAYYLRGDGKTGGLFTPVSTDGADNKAISFDGTHPVSYESAPLVNATRYAGVIAIAMTGKFSPAVTDIKATLSVDGTPVTYGWANPRFYKGLDQVATITPGSNYSFSLEMMPRDFTVLPGSRIELKLEGFQGSAQVTLALDRTAVNMPVVPVANVIEVMKLN
ncbi:CocE/NonD family hydrolase [Paraburkholderia dilworthii]|uniref:CocE/NonD family hydrolase n=1 Tax=Paraburkholderia dilworthii TaxID=948106 RepID=A0ABW9DC54_9BURK